MKIACSFYALALGLVLSQAHTAHAAKPISLGFYPSYRAELTPDKIRYDRFTHLAHSFVTVDAEGKLKVPGTMPSQALTKEAHAHGVKVLLAMGGGADGKLFAAMVRSTTLREQFIKDFAQMVKDNNYDGAVVDWEFPLAEDKPIVPEFVAGLRAALRAQDSNSIMALAVNSKPNNSKGYDGEKLKDNVDMLLVMTYDFHGPWSHAGHNTALYEMTGDTSDGKVLTFGSALSYWRDVQGFRSSQILLGLAAYGRGFKVSNWGEKPTAPSQYPTIAFKTARTLVGNGWTRQWDAESHVPWLLSDDKTDRISYDDEVSVAEKAQWMKKNGLPGFFMWEIWQDYTEGDNLLAAAANKAWDTAP